MSGKIKVAEFITRLEFGGVEAVLINYTNYFKNRNDFDLHIITQDINDEKCIEQFRALGFTVHIVTHKRKSMLKNIIEINRILRTEKFRVVHSHMTMTNFYVLFMSWTFGAKLRISHSHNAFKAEGVKQKLVWPILKWLNRVSANVWAACGYDAGEFLFGQKAMKSGRVYIMNNAIDVEKFKYNQEIRERIRQQYKIGNSPCVGHVGRFMKQKNHKFLVEIFASLLKTVPDAKLLLIGAGELEGEVRNQVKQMGIEKSVIFTGNVTNPNDFYQAMDVFILPSLFEGLPVVSIEAQTADLPCLISDKVDSRCALTDNVHFMSIEKSKDEWAREIEKLLKHDRGQDVIKRIEAAQYNINTEAEKLQNLYTMVLN